jgi:hypothetical protein
MDRLDPKEMRGNKEKWVLLVPLVQLAQMDPLVLREMQGNQEKWVLLVQKGTLAHMDRLDPKEMRGNKEKWVLLVPLVQPAQKETPALGFHLYLQTFMDK